MKQLYVLDNGAEYSSHCIEFVWEDPDEWDDLEGLLKLWDCVYYQNTQVILTTTVPEWRDPMRCSRASDLFDPWNGADLELVLPKLTRRDRLNLLRGWIENPPDRVEWQVKKWPERCQELKRKIEALK